ncbi:MAG: YraN family protein [Gammaproteobacteria bacterium]|jgi:putative endonuclease|nr:YraN family protein [Gammaproteobacteria bacterium]
MNGPRRTVDIGRAAEEAAAEFLRSHGLREIGRNFRCHGGEIDLIMRHDEYLVFVEVRYRSSRRFGGAMESIVASKQRRLLHAAQRYLLQHKGGMPPVRFDVIAASPDVDGLHFDWIVDAFRVDEGWGR